MLETIYILMFSRSTPDASKDMKTWLLFLLLNLDHSPLIRAKNYAMLRAPRGDLHNHLENPSTYGA